MTDKSSNDSKFKLTKSQRQHAERSSFFKCLTAKVENKQANQFTALFKKLPSYGFAIDEAFPDENSEIVTMGRVDYDRAQTRAKA